MALLLSILDLPTSPLDETGFISKGSAYLRKVVNILGALFGGKDKIATPLAALSKIFLIALVALLTASWSEDVILPFAPALSDLFDTVSNVATF